MPRPATTAAARTERRAGGWFAIERQYKSKYWVLMRRTHGLIALAILHHVTIAAALVGLLWCCLGGQKAGMTLFVLELSAFGFFSVIVRRAWASIDGGEWLKAF